MNEKPLILGLIVLAALFAYYAIFVRLGFTKGEQFGGHGATGSW